MNIAIWHHEREDHANWNRLCGERISYDDFVRRLDTTCEEAANRDHDVWLVDISVTEMEERLKNLGMENTPDNRAFVAASIVASQPNSDKARRYRRNLGKNVFE